MKYWIIIPLFFFLYTPFSIAVSFRAAWWKRVIGAMLMFSLLFVLQAALFQRYFPRWILIPCAWMSGVFILSNPMFFLRDLVWLGFSLAKKKFPVRKTMWIIFAVSAALAAVGEWNALRPPKVRTEEVELNGLPEAFDGFTVVYLADLHVNPMSSPLYLWTIVCRTNAQNPDLILLGGDLGDLGKDELKKYMHQLGDLHAKHGIFSAPGNHDNFDSWFDMLDSLGIKTLLNSHIDIERNGSRIVIAGLADGGLYSMPKANREPPDLNKALAGLGKDVPVILLEHRPWNAKANAARGGVSLQLSGHTHGGMIAGPGVLLIKLFNNGFAAGWYQVGGMKLYVSRGAGLWNGFPFRLGVPSEITKIVLRRRSDS